MADPKVVNLYPSSTTDNKVNKLTKVLAKTFFYDGYSFDQLSSIVGWMYKDPIKFGSNCRRIGVGMVEYKSYTDITGEEFKEEIPKRPNWIEEEYGHELKVRVSTVWSELANADKFDNAADYQQYIQLMKGKVKTVLDLVPYTVLLGLVALIDTAKQELITTISKTTHKLDATNPQVKQIFDLAFTNLVKQTGSAKYNDDVTWNDFANHIKEDFLKIKNIWVSDEDAANDEEDGVSSKYAQQYIRLARDIGRGVDQLCSPIFNVNNTIDTDAYAAGAEAEQTWATNTKPSRLVLVMSRTDLLELKYLYSPGINLTEITNINKYGIGTIVGVDGLPGGCWALFDKHFINVHPQYLGTFMHTNADFAATKSVTHLRFKYGTLSKVPGMVYISKTWKKPAFIKKKKSS